MKRLFIVIIRNIDEFKEYYPVFSRCISSSFMISHGLRENVLLFFYFLSEKTIIRFLGNRLRQIRPDEQSLYGIIKKIIRFVESDRKKGRLHTGILAYRGNLHNFLRLDKQTYILVEDNKGIDIRKLKISKPSRVIYIVSLSYLDFNTIKKMVRGNNILRVKTSIESLFPDNLIVLVNNELDRRFYEK